MSTFTSTTTITITTNTTYFMDPNPMDSITQLSLFKLYQQENALEEPILRKKVLIRNTLLMACMVTTEQEKQKEQCWLDACFDQLDEDMEDTNISTDSMDSSSSFIPPPPPLPSLPPSLIPPSQPSSSFLYPSSSTPSSTTTTNPSSSSHTLVLAIPSEHDKFLALLDWSWSATSSSSSL